MFLLRTAGGVPALNPSLSTPDMSNRVIARHASQPHTCCVCATAATPATTHTMLLSEIVRPIVIVAK